MGVGRIGDHGPCLVFQEGVGAAVHGQSPGGWQEWGGHSAHLVFYSLAGGGPLSRFLPRGAAEEPEDLDQSSGGCRGACRQVFHLYVSDKRSAGK